MWKDTREDRLNRYKQILQQCPQLYQPATDCENSDKKSMTETVSDSADEANVYDHVLAPALYGFVCWVLREAVANGIQRLYFLARDGYFMYLIAQKLCEKLQLPVSCQYLSCSRYSIRLPMYHRDYEEALGYICRGGIDLTMDRILNRAALDEEEKQQVLDNLNEKLKSSFQMKEHLPYAKLQQIRQCLCENVYFRGCLERHSKEALPGLEGYLKQEGLLDDIPSALVDSGWVGSMQKVLNEAIQYIRQRDISKEAAGRRARISDALGVNPGDAGQNDSKMDEKELEGYYWGLYELPEAVNPSNYHCYYFSPGEHIREKVYFSNCLFETIFSAPHGMTMGYAKKGDTYMPVYTQISAAQYEFMKNVEWHIVRYIEQMLPNIRTRKDLDCKNDRKTIYKLLRIFMGEPTGMEAELFGRHRFSDDVLDDGNRQIAEQMTEEELTSNHIWNKIRAMCGWKDAYVKESAWYEGSAVRNGQHVKKHLRRYAAYKYLLYMRKKRLWRKIYG